MAPKIRGEKRPPPWPCADEEKSDYKRTLECARGVQEYRCSYRAGDAPQPPRVNTWVQVLPESDGRYIKVSDRATAEAPALVSAVTLEDGVGSATVIYPNRLVLLHGFDGAPWVRVLVPFRRLRPCTASIAELRALEQRLREAIYAQVKKKKLPSGVTVLEGKFGYGNLEGTALREDFAPQANAAAAATSEEPQTPATPSPRKLTAGRAVLGQAGAAPLAAPFVRSAEKVVVAPSGRLDALTRAVSRALRGSEGLRLPLGELVEALAAEFDEATVRAGLAQLEDQNKLYVADELVIGIF